MKGNREVGRWDIENQRPMDEFEVDRALRKALQRTGYLHETERQW
ncbi:MAG: hypothetical protein C1O27_002149 [Chloroflexi bacterium]|jgi:hypothetical protein|nr:MAG: hypothetical protein C1O27_002149 [Chloroflexota bacterium]